MNCPRCDSPCKVPSKNTLAMFVCHGLDCKDHAFYYHREDRFTLTIFYNNKLFSFKRWDDKCYIVNDNLKLKEFETQDYNQAAKTLNSYVKLIIFS